MDFFMLHMRSRRVFLFFICLFAWLQWMNKNKYMHALIKNVLNLKPHPCDLWHILDNHGTINKWIKCTNWFISIQHSPKVVWLHPVYFRCCTHQNNSRWSPGDSIIYTESCRLCFPTCAVSSRLIKIHQSERDANKFPQSANKCSVISRLHSTGCTCCPRYI